MVEGVDLEFKDLEVLFLAKESDWGPRRCCVGDGKLKDA